MRASRIKTIFIKEVRELFRDKKAMFTMFALPLIIYPILIIGVSVVLTNVMESYESKQYLVGYSENISEEVIEYICAEGDSEDQDAVLTPVSGIDDYMYALDSRQIDVYIDYDNTNSVYTAKYNTSSQDSTYARDFVLDRLENMRKERTENLLSQQGLNAREYMIPFEIESENTASDEKSMGSTIGMVVPLLLIIGVFIGTMTPAVDVTAGEKERGTQETLMTFPISGKELITGKFLAVSFFGVLSALLYLVSIGILVGYIEIMSEVSLDLSSFIPAVSVVIVTVIAFALFLGAVIMCICSFTSSTKEASSYISPLMIVVMLISYTGYLDIRLTTVLSVVPILNIVLLIKSVLQFEYNITAILIVLFSNIMYAAIAINALGKLYTSERILFGEHEGSLFARDTQRKKGSVPYPGDGILILLIAFVIYTYLGSLLQVKSGTPGLGISQLILLAVPLFATYWGNKDYTEVFSLKKVRPGMLLCVFILGIGSFIIGNFAVSIIASSSRSSREYSESMTNLMESNGLFVTWLCIAVAPAVCEEALFRGYFYSSLKRKFNPVRVCVITALLFGIYHLNLYQGIYAFLLGLVLAYAVYATGSIFCSSLIHLVCNSMAVFLYCVKPFQEFIDNLPEIGIIVFGVIFILIGIMNVRKPQGRKN